MPMASITPSTSTNALDARKTKFFKKNARQEALYDANEILQSTIFLLTSHDQRN
jgi:hypothetical protein